MFLDAYFAKKYINFKQFKNLTKLIKLEYNKSITEFTTFGVPVSASYFVSFDSKELLIKILNDENLKSKKKLILGGGSNILFTENFDGLVLKNELKGIEVISEDKEEVIVKVGAGENWHEFVLFCVEKGWGGVENLSLIPGSVGASPMQNIGAYGVEIKDVFIQLEAINLETNQIEVFSKDECKFGYRESIFKNTHKNKYIITSVSFKLSKKPQFNTSYGAIEKELENMKVSELSIKAISDAVIAIRSSKLPDPKVIGNAGSFFKNPVISEDKFEKLIEKFPEIAHYPQLDGTVKIAAGWLIDKLGWKGKSFDSYGVHKNQALVLVNYGESKGSDIYDLSTDILNSVKDTFDIELEREVNIC